MTILDTFIAGISAQPQPLLARVSGTLLFEIHDPHGTEHSLVTVDKGRVGIEAVDGPVEADATVRGERPLLEAIAQGRANAMSAILRGAVRVEGDAELLVVFQRLFPGPEDSRSR